MGSQYERKILKFLRFGLQEKLDPKNLQISSNLQDAVKVRCQICQTILLLSDLKQHCQSNHQITLPEYEDLYGSRKVHIIKQIFHQCSLCGEVLLLDILELKEHFDEIKHEKSFKDYQKEFIIYDSFYYCDECARKYKNKKSLKTHKSRSHNSKSTLECPEKCGAFLTCQSSMKKHMMSHLPQDLWPHQCHLCKKRFQAKVDVTKHLKSRIHQNDKVKMDENESIVTYEEFEILCKSIDANIAEAKEILCAYNMALSKF